MNRAIVLVLAIIFGAPLAFADGGMNSHPHHSRGGMWGMSHGMMTFFSELPSEKQELLRTMHVKSAQAIMIQRATLKGHRLALRVIMRKFPLDQKAAKSQWKAVESSREKLFQLRLDRRVQSQRILGKEQWERARSMMVKRWARAMDGKGGMGGMGGAQHQRQMMRHSKAPK